MAMAPGAPARCRGKGQITLSRLPCLRHNWSKKATELSPLLFPSSSIHSTSLVSRHTAE